jgi:ribosomal-protein-alanine N-acetyltransferase
MTQTPKWRTPAPWLPLRTERLMLREFRENDFDDLHEYGSDPKVSRFMTWGPNTPKVSREYLDRALADQAVWPREVVNMAVEVAAEEKLIGALRFAVVDAPSLTADFGYTLNRAYWGRGYATEAAGAVIRQAFEVLGVRRVFATCDVRNTGSWTVMEKLGMRREARFRRDVKARSGWRDTYLYAILAGEWRRAGRAGGGGAGSR